MKTILLVEDDSLILRGLKENLEGQGFRVLAERDGKKGYQLAVKSRPDLAILDVMLPSMTGFEICSVLKQSGYEFPIFLLTGLSAENQRLQGLEQGADDYITKPFSVQELLLRVRNALQRSEQMGRRGQLAHEELSKAREIQIKSLPQQDPHVEGLEVHGEMVPALQVGGDYFDYINLGEKKLAVVVADVSGKGIPAALHVHKMQGIIQSSKDRFSGASDVLLQLQNHLGLNLEPSSFVTAVVAVFDLSKTTLEIARAGHLPVLLKRGNKVKELKPPGFWLGKSQAGSFERVLRPMTLGLETGDVIVFYTDGIIESRNKKGAEFGLQRLKKLISSAKGSPLAMTATCFKKLDDFVGTTPPHDDKTVVLAKIVSKRKTHEANPRG